MWTAPYWLHVVAINFKSALQHNLWFLDLYEVYGSYRFTTAMCPILMCFFFLSCWKVKAEIVIFSRQNVFQNRSSSTVASVKNVVTKSATRIHMVPSVSYDYIWTCMSCNSRILIVHSESKPTKSKMSIFWKRVSILVMKFLVQTQKQNCKKFKNKIQKAS